MIGKEELWLQALLGHTTLVMVNRYIQMVDDDLVSAHRKHGPIDNILRRRWKRKATAMVAFLLP